MARANSLDEYPAAGASSVLLLAPDQDPHDDAACCDLLTRDSETAVNVLSVTLDATPDERLSAWQREVDGSLPKRAKIIDAGSGVSETSQVAGTEAFPQIDVESLPADADLTDLSLSIGSTLGEWQATSEASVLCFHSLSSLLESFALERVIGLVNGLNDLSGRLDVRAHHHLDPAAHADETLAMLRPLYDTVVEHVPPDGWIVTSADRSSLKPSFRTTTTPPDGATKPGNDRQEATPEPPETVPIPHSFETVIDLISLPRRRSILYELSAHSDGAMGLEELVDRVYEREQAIAATGSAGSREEVMASLVHMHLPKLDDDEVLDYDADERLVRYDANPALESFVRYVETLDFD